MQFIPLHKCGIYYRGPGVKVTVFCFFPSTEDIYHLTAFWGKLTSFLSHEKFDGVIRTTDETAGKHLLNTTSEQHF